MSPEYKYFLIFDGLVLLALLWWFFRREKRPKVRLRLKNSSAKTSHSLKGSVFAAPAQMSESADDSPEDRSLTVNFNYNGHSFEAYETLGLPAGSSLTAAEQAYAKAVSSVDAESREFLKAALEALRKDHRRSSVSS